MSHAFRIASIKHEAEVYLSQGLHEEALSVYNKFITENKDIQPAMKSTIKEFMRLIESDALKADRDENELLSEIEITWIKKGWENDSSPKDRLTSANVFLNLGLYADAFEEYRQLLEDGCLTSGVFEGTAQCIAHLTYPNHIVIVVDQLARSIFNSAKNQKAFKLIIANKINAKEHTRHLLALKHHIAELKEEKIAP